VDAHAEVARLLAKARPTAGTRGEAGQPSERSYELYVERGENFRSVRVEVTADHLQIDTHDMGRAPEEFWGDGDYEFWTIVQRAEWPKLLAAFAKEVDAETWAADPEVWRNLSGKKQSKLLMKVCKVLFAGDSRATDRLHDLCQKHDVESKWGSWV